MSKSYIKQGMIVVRIHKIFSFEQSKSLEKQKSSKIQKKDQTVYD